MKEELLPVLVPVAVYWMASGFHLIFNRTRKWRVFTEEEEEAENSVTRREVLVNVLLNQAVQIAFATITFAIKQERIEDQSPTVETSTTSLLHLAKQITIAIFVMDTWGYFWHRLTHQNHFLMKHVHSVHHRVIATYPYATQYLHPLEFFFGDLSPSIAAIFLSGMSPRTAAVFFSVVTLKIVDDHCGYWFMRHIPALPFSTYGTGFHMVHHLRQGLKCNYSPYFFYVWDVLLGTYLPYSVEKRESGEGLELSWESMGLGMPDELLPVLVPVAVYWVASGFHAITAGRTNSRLFTEEEEEVQNLVPRKEVLANVLINQATQIVSAAAAFMIKPAKTEGENSIIEAPAASPLHLAHQIIIATFIMDTWGYFWHRLTHQNRFLMKHVHSLHHRIIAPYAYAAQYLHPLDFLVASAAPGVTAIFISGMSPRTAAIFFSVLMVKAVDGHCGYWFMSYIPAFPLSTYKTGFHVVHHQHKGFKYNFSPYFFCYWDVLLGTYLPYSVEEREDGEGYRLHTAKIAVE